MDELCDKPLGDDQGIKSDAINNNESSEIVWEAIEGRRNRGS